MYTGLNAEIPMYGTGYWYESDPYNYYQPTIFYNGSNPAQPDSVVFDATMYKVTIHFTGYFKWGMQRYSML